MKASNNHSLINGIMNNSSPQTAMYGSKMSSQLGGTRQTKTTYRHYLTRDRVCFPLANQCYIRKYKTICNVCKFFLLAAHNDQLNY